MFTVLAHTILALALSASQDVAAPRPMLPRLAGQWVGTGTVNNARVSANAEFGGVLANRFTRLTYAFSVEGAGVVFEGHAYYACAAGPACQGNWFDSQGSTHVLSGVQGADALTSEWGDGTVARGRTEYRLTADDSLIVTDWIRTAAGEWRQFGRVEYRRKPAS